ncbi:MAG: RNA polymerase sigma factor, partial [Planctomycetia bacterium]
MTKSYSRTPFDGSVDLDGLTDEWLMAAYNNGNDGCLAVLLQRYQRELYSYLRRYLADAGLAEDVFQNTFLALHLKRGLYEEGRPFRPWLYKIATHQAIDALRRNQRHRRPSLDAEGKSGGEGAMLDGLTAAGVEPSVSFERSEQQSLVRKTVDGLPEHLRAVVSLSYYQGMKYKE